MWAFKIRLNKKRLKILNKHLTIIELFGINIYNDGPHNNNIVRKYEIIRNIKLN